MRVFFLFSCLKKSRTFFISHPRRVISNFSWPYKPEDLSKFFLCVLGCRGQNHNQGLEFIDILTAPTLQPKEASSVVSSGSFFSIRPSGIQQPRGLITPDNENSEEKLTIITPSSVVVMSTAMPRPQPTTTVSVASEAVATDAFLDSPAETMSQPQDVSVSHSFSVVSVKYSASSSEAAIKPKVQRLSGGKVENCNNRYILVFHKGV